VTATTTTSDAAAYSASGFTGTLGKPFTLEALRAVLAAHLGGAAAAAAAAAPRASLHAHQPEVVVVGGGGGGPRTPEQAPAQPRPTLELAVAAPPPSVKGGSRRHL
jgi:hypothetical protein